MASRTVEVIHGKRHRYEIRQEAESLFSLGPKFHIYRSGEYWKGTYSSLARAVEAARNAG
jgi:hypothetical protein